MFETLRKLAASGCSILYISHKLHEIVALCDTATILRGGKVVAHCDPKRETSRSMAEMMIGANLKEIAKPADARLRPAEARGAGPEPAASRANSASRCRTWRSRSGRARSSASPASPATGRTSFSSAMSGETLAPTARGDHACGQGRRPARRHRAAQSRLVRGARGAQRPRGGRRVLAHRQRLADRARPHGDGAASASSTRPRRPTTPPK